MPYFIGILYSFYYFSIFSLCIFANNFWRLDFSSLKVRHYSQFLTSIFIHFAAFSMSSQEKTP